MPFLVVGLDILVSHISYDKFKEKPAIQKINFLYSEMKEICQTLKNNGSTIVFAYREYGIDSPHSRFVTNQDKAYFKKAFSNLTKDEDAIVFAPLAVKRTFKKISPTRKKQLENYFEKENAKKKSLTGQKFFNEFKTRTSKLKDENIAIVRNTCYVFYKGKCIQRIDKTVLDDKELFHHHLDEASDANMIYQMGNKKDNNILVEFPEMMFIIEMCLAHKSGLAKFTFPQATNKANTAQLVLSDSVDTVIPHIICLFYLRVDSMQVSFPIGQENKNIIFYRKNILKSTGKLEGPLPMTNPADSFFLACYEKKENVVKDLFSKNKFPDTEAEKSLYGMTCVHMAIIKGSVSVLKLLIQHSINCSLIDNDHNTPLLLTLIDKLSEMTMLLLNSGKELNINAINLENKTALYYAIKQNSLKLVMDLLTHGANPNLECIKIPPLLLALKNNCKFEIIKALVDHGADINIRGPNGETLLLTSIHNNSYDLTELFVKAGVNVPGSDHLTPLMLAVHYNDLDVIELLLKEGADINQVSNSFTPLTFAVQNKKVNLDTISFLLEKAKKISVNNIDDSLEKAIELEDQNIIRIFEDYKKATKSVKNIKST